MTVVQGDPLPRDPQGAVSSSGGTVVQGDPLPRDPRRSSVDLRRLLLFPAIIFELGLTLIGYPATILVLRSPAIPCDV